MAWIGYFEFNGEEIVNASRTEAYAKAAGVGWFRPVYGNDAIGPIMGDRYDSPMQDDAPWTDPDNLDTYDFWGCYPLDVTGIEDATTSASVTESTLDGGVVGRARRTTKAVVFSLLLVGMSECGVEAGFRWLKSALGGNPCEGQGQSSCAGNDLCYFSCEPCIDWEHCDDPSDADGCLARYFRSLRKVGVTTGPTVTGKRVMVDGGCSWTVTVTMVAGNPYEYSGERRLIKNFMKTGVTNPYVPSAPTKNGTPYPYDMTGHIETEQRCPTRVYVPLEDPDCPATILPPNVPSNVRLSCFTFPVNYTRRSFVIPPEVVPLWTDVVPYLVVKAKSEVRSLRLRFYPDVLGRLNPKDDPCAYCGDIVFSYIPPNSTLVFDGADETVYVERGGGVRQRADTIVFDSDGGPFDWPQLTCGYAYIVALDMPKSQDDDLPVVDFSLYAKVA
jgi:hypothetical protein